jgi:hypothetical protein
VYAHQRGARRWTAKLRNDGKQTDLGTFDREEDAAHAWDRMMLWCHLHGVVLKRLGGGGVRVLDSSGIKASLNFAYEEYESEEDELLGILTQDAMVQKLQQEGRLQPGCRRR